MRPAPSAATIAASTRVLFLAARFTPIVTASVSPIWTYRPFT
jgi:hypothetical protein